MEFLRFLVWKIIRNHLIAGNFQEYNIIDCLYQCNIYFFSLMLISPTKYDPWDTVLDFTLSDPEFLPATSSLFSKHEEYRSDSFLHLLEQIKMRRSGYLRRETVRIPPTSVRSKDHSEIEISKIRISAPETGAPFGVGRLWHHAHGT